MASPFHSDVEPHRKGPPGVTDWSLCVLCQQDDELLLQDPNKGTKFGPGHGYKSIATNLDTLANLDALPFEIDLTRLNDGSGIEQTLMKNQAKWHEKCRNKCSNREIQRAETRKLKEEDVSNKSSPVKKKLRITPSQPKTKEPKVPTCFFCKEEADTTSTDVHIAMTQNFNANVNHMAYALRRQDLIGELAGGDTTALDAIYHLHCYASLRNSYRTFLRQNESTCYASENLKAESIATAELISYIEEYDDGCTVFKLPDLVKMYHTRLVELGDAPDRVNSTRLKDKLLKAMPQLEANKAQGCIVISYKVNVGDVLLSACKQSSDEDAVTLMRAAQIVRRDLFQQEYKFEGSLTAGKYEQYPRSLTALNQMILSGTSLTPDYPTEFSSAALSITQLMIYNSTKRTRKGYTSETVRHNPKRETPVPLYLGFLIHSKTRKKELVDTLHEHGLCVSYDRVMQLSADMANKVIAQYQMEGVVCPPKLKTGLFVTSQQDNVDHNLTSTSAKESFHGTALSLTCHVTTTNSGKERTIDENFVVPKQRIIDELPDDYTDVRPAFLPKENPLPPATLSVTEVNANVDPSSWVDAVSDLINKEALGKDDNISWSAHHANLQKEVPHPPAVIELLPLFKDNAHSVAMMKHGMDMLKRATEHLNPGQVPVVTVDCALYPILKKIQWTWPERYGEEKYVVMMGGLHVEMAFLACIGDWLEDSGWASIMAMAGVTTEGRALGIEKGTCTARGQWAHQTCLAALSLLQRRAYEEYKEEKETPLEFNEWKSDKNSQHPQFSYWNTTMKLQSILLKFLKAQREGEFPDYLKSLQAIVPWMFILDHWNYARWMSVHIHDLEVLEKTCTAVHIEFMKGHFVTQKGCHKFSMLAHDQVHEQLNAVVKGEGGIIGITENEAALKRWMVAGPEIAAVLSEYEDRFCQKISSSDKHHEQSMGKQEQFCKDVKNIVRCIEEKGNPFTEDSKDLLTMHTKVIMPSEVVESVMSAEEKGQGQSKSFANREPGQFYDAIARNKVPLFSCTNKFKGKRKPSQLATAKEDINLFSRMYVSCQNRDGDMANFFSHENHAWPPSLAENGNMRIAENKSDLLTLLEPLAEKHLLAPEVEVKVVDGAALVHSLDPKFQKKKLRTFKDYSDQMFIPNVLKKLQSCERCDIVWDVYKQGSLKAHTRQQRGVGQRMRVNEEIGLPTNWKTFLRVDANKTALFQFLSEELSHINLPGGKTIVTTLDERVLLEGEAIDTAGLEPCNHEEADTRMLIHCRHAYDQGARKLMCIATDTDVVILAIETVTWLPDCELWIEFGHGKHLRYIPAHMIGASIGQDSCRALPYFHAFSGSDTTSCFKGIGKKTAWDTWRIYPDVTQVFINLSQSPTEISEDDFAIIQRFTVLMYKRTSPLLKVNEARLQLFAQGGRQIDHIPPTQAALMKHTQRAAYQAGHVWGQSLITHQELVSPSEWGWKKEGDMWCPVWSSMPEASKACQELIKCTCLPGRKCRSCKCGKAKLPCTHLCGCTGQCD